MPPITDALPDVRRELRFFPLDVYSAAEADANRTYFDGLMARATAAGWDAYAINGWQLRCEGMYDMIVEPRILDYVQDLLGENLVCWGAHFFCKMPGDERRVSFHQDASYWPLTPSKTVTVWLVLWITSCVTYWRLRRPFVRRPRTSGSAGRGGRPV